MSYIKEVLTAVIIVSTQLVPPALYAAGTSFKGSNFTLLENNGSNTSGGANDLAVSWNGLTTTDLADTNFSNMTIASDTPYEGELWQAHHIRVFDEGSYTFDTTCTVAEIEAGTTLCNNPLQVDLGQTEQFITMTVGIGQIGTHMLFDWSVYKNTDVVNVYDTNSVFKTLDTGGLCTGGGYGPYPWSGAPNPDTTAWRMTSTDNNGDGIAGIPMIDGGLVGFNANFNFDIPEKESNFTMLDGTGGNVQGGANDVNVHWNGATTADAADTNFSNMSLSSDTTFLGSVWSAHHIRVFGEGTYTFDTTCSVTEIEAGTTDCNNSLQVGLGQTEQFLTMTVGPGQIGTHILFDWFNSQNTDIVNVYNINTGFVTGGSGELFTGGGYGPYPWSGSPDPINTEWRMASTDNDGDGIAGVQMVDGELIGFSANFNIFLSSRIIYFDGGIVNRISATCDEFSQDETNNTTSSGSGAVSLLSLAVLGLLGLCRRKVCHSITVDQLASSSDEA